MNTPYQPLTLDVLRDMILQCLEDFELIMPYPKASPELPAEPVSNEDPPQLITEQLGSIVGRLRKLSPEQQKKICNALGFHGLDDVIDFIRRLQGAIKGK